MGGAAGWRIWLGNRLLVLGRGFMGHGIGPHVGLPTQQGVYLGYLFLYPYPLLMHAFSLSVLSVIVSLALK